MRVVRFAVFLPLLLAGCVFGGGGGEESRPSASIRTRGGSPVPVTLPTPRVTQQCFTDLTRANVRFSPLPNLDYGSGCTQVGTVQLIDIGVPVTNTKAMQCGLAQTFTAWVRNGVQPAVREMLGTELVRVESFGTYSCRGIIGGGAQTAGRISEHATANAIDISAFVLADGRRITIERDWRSADMQVRAFLDVIHRSACRRFGTVLSPDYNAAHYNHLHLDMGRGPFCR